MPSPVTVPPPTLFPAPLAAFLSYLVPGLGQIYQRRTGKGVLFLICVYSLFFYGMALGSWRNVYLPRATGLPDAGIFPLKNMPNGALKSLGYRPQFIGQFWVGVAAWPALYQYANYDEIDRKVDPLLGNFDRTPSEQELNDWQIHGDKTWDLGWVFTVIAGALNVLVIYDAFAGPAFTAVEPEKVALEKAVPA